MKPHILTVIAGLVLSISSGILHADGVDDYVKAQMQKRQIPGLSLAVIKDEKVVKTQGYGFASLELQVPATPHTVYEIGSISKQFTAAVVMMLVEEGKVRLQDSIAYYLAQLPPAWRKVSIRQLLTHTSGIPDFEPVIGYSSYRNAYTDESLLKAVADRPMDFSPGESWNYSNTGYVLLGMLLEKVTGKAYGQIMRERIFQPCGMVESRESDPPAVIPNRADGYALEAKTIVNRDPMQPTACKGAGTLVSTVLDLAKWDAALSSESLLEKTSLEEMWKPVALNDGKTFPYGFGWFLEPWQGHKNLSHSGGTAGFTTVISRFGDDHLTVVLLTNLYSFATIEKMAKTVAGFFVPALAPPVYTAIPDSEPSFTARMKELYMTRLEAYAKWDPAFFTPGFWATLKPLLSLPGSLDYYKAIGPPISVELVERRSEGDNTLFRYRLTYKEISRLILVTTDESRKISSFMAEEE